jgi:hypothetical protein
MYARLFPRLSAASACFGILCLAAFPAAAQSSSRGGQNQAPSQADSSQQHQHDMQQMTHDEPSMASTRRGSGTSWLPDETPMYAIHSESGGWMLMAHGNGFLQYLHESGKRGADQAGSIGWVMGMADRPMAGGHFGLRGMISLEPWTVRGCGYPDLLASGETCKGDAIHDRQHPHDAFMELAAEFDRSVGAGLRLQVYGGPAGEPALGPVAFPHRISAMANPLAPITHHWFDSSHVTYGVVTAGLYGNRWKAETSLFNGREPDESRTGFDFAALDSWSGRLWFLPSSQWALQVSAGRLNEAEAGHDEGPRVDVKRVNASATYHRELRPGSIWANTVGWGRNAEPAGDATNTLLVESSLELAERHAWFGRFEAAQKSGHDLAVDLDDVFTVAKLQGGYTRYFEEWHGLKPGIGAALSSGVVPQTLKPLYGSRFNLGFGVYATIRPGEHGR